MDILYYHILLEIIFQTKLEQEKFLQTLQNLKRALKKAVSNQIERLMSVNGTKSVDHFHKSN